MKYISIDLETTGIKSENCEVLQFAAIIEDTQNPKSFEDSPKFNCFIVREQLKGEPFALQMNAWILKHIADYISADENGKEELTRSLGVKFLYDFEVAKEFLRWLIENEYHLEFTPNLTFDKESEIFPTLKWNEKVEIAAAGKNFASFDLKFIEKLPLFTGYFRFKGRVVDPGPLFADWKNDKELPNLNRCIQRAGLQGSVTHDALQDAWDVIRVMRTKY